MKKSNLKSCKKKSNYIFKFIFCRYCDGIRWCERQEVCGMERDGMDLENHNRSDLNQGPPSRHLLIYDTGAVPCYTSAGTVWNLSGQMMWKWTFLTIVKVDLRTWKNDRTDLHAYQWGWCGVCDVVEWCHGVLIPKILQTFWGFMV